MARSTKFLPSFQQENFWPYIFSLLPEKSSIRYRHMWGAMHQELSTAVAMRFGEPGSIGMDFEVAPATEMEKCFPVAMVTGGSFYWHTALLDQSGKKGCKM
jgi:hypothetical protein